ncbi:hypothetical protein ACFWZU_11825 [Frateuria sp. GZRR33]|uniref:hypothetical protein n=1 Tax=Frateuria sp. GZRR33 TaxID=3351535 RepID=UPI003EDBBBBB
MRRLLATVFACLLAGACASPATSHAEGLCHAGETTYFSCTASSGKTISLCGNVPAALQYRYGKASKLELAFPRDASQGARQLGYAHYTRFQVARTEVGFTRVDVDYAVFDETEDGRRAAGVRVTTADGREHEVACAGAIHGRLETLGGSLRCDADNALNGGNCP